MKVLRKILISFLILVLLIIFMYIMGYEFYIEQGVPLSDYLKLEEECSKLREENNALKSALRRRR